MTHPDAGLPARRAPRLRTLIWGGAALMLAAPAVAMLFTQEVRWGPLDFTVFAAMLAAAGAGLDLAARASADWIWRAAAAAALGTGFLLVWAALAVGVIGDEGNPADLMFAGVLAVAVAGAVLARGRARPMALAMAAAALAQLAVAGVVLARGWPGLAPTLAFTPPWLVSAGLFRLAARRQGASGR